jgi:hypothetical protein
VWDDMRTAGPPLVAALLSRAAARVSSPAPHHTPLTNNTD